MNPGLIPFDFNSHMVRAFMRAGDPWFVLADVCKVLDIRNPSDAARRLDDDETHTLGITEGISAMGVAPQVQSLTIINESGLYSLTLTSRKEEARRFRKWITAELLPTLRKTGRYALASADEGAGAPLLILSEVDTPRLQAMVATIRVAERLHGRPAAQAVWAGFGLPDFRDDGAVADPTDPLLGLLARHLAGVESITIAEAAVALGLGRPDRAMSRRLGALLRHLGWQSRVERARGGHTARTWRPATTIEAERIMQ